MSRRSDHLISSALGFGARRSARDVDSGGLEGLAGTKMGISTAGGRGGGNLLGLCCLDDYGELRMQRIEGGA